MVIILDFLLRFVAFYSSSLIVKRPTAVFSQVTRFPNDNLGLILLSNDDEFGTEIHEIVRWKLAEHILGLKSIDWKTRYVLQT
jgi:hypothetical protein